jgi:putative acetyltransferase
LVWLRAEEEADRDGVRRVVETAFGQLDEADIVDRLREGGDLFMSHLADRKGEIIAHLAFSPTQVVAEDGTPREIRGGLLALAPMAVAPKYQRQMIGQGLLRSALMRLERAGVGAIVVLGHPAYYPRFGFTPASGFGLRCPLDAPDEAFLLRSFGEHPADSFCGMLKYAPAFDG